MKNKVYKAMVSVTFLGVFIALGVSVSAEAASSETVLSDIETNSENTSDISAYPEYEEIVQKYYDGILSHWTMQEYNENGLAYITYTIENLDDFGYYIVDVDEDGTEELFLGPVNKNGYIGMFYDLYTMKDGKLVQIMTSGERDRYYLCEDNEIANEGSGSAMTSSWAYYNLVSGELVMKEHILYDAYYDEENPWFYSTSDEWGDYSSPVTEEAARSMIASREYMDIPYIPLLMLDANELTLDNEAREIFD